VAGRDIGGEHAITGTYPLLDDVIAFKERPAEAEHGYYRFVKHRAVRSLEAALCARFDRRHCRLTESLQVALHELNLCLQTPPGTERSDVVVLTAEEGALPVPTPAAAAAKFIVLGLRAGGLRAGAVLGSSDRIMDALAEQMKRRGPILSSRVAAVFAGCGPAGGATSVAAADPAESAVGAPPSGAEHSPTDGAPPSGAERSPADAAPSRVADALCRLERGTDAFLYSSGMAAITRVLELLCRPGRSQVVAVGHLYSDTHQSLRLGDAHFLEVDELDRLEGLVGGETAAIFTETITNPLSDVPDLDVLARVARAHGVPLVVDNTIATPANCRPFEHGADYVIHSTTKFLNGRNDHGGGVVIVRDPAAARMLAESQALLDDSMSPLEAAVLEERMGSFEERMRRFNANALRVAAFLEAHHGVARVFFNALPSHRSYSVARRILKGPGSVIGFALRNDTLEGLRAFYDSALIGIHKAPSLGSDETLLCPYTLLTHYESTDEELAAIGLPRFLLRVAVGSERDIGPVLASLDEALGAAGVER
jgi:O-acetylhomoserine (thiol)-lyase